MPDSTTIFSNNGAPLSIDGRIFTFKPGTRATKLDEWHTAREAQLPGLMFCDLAVLYNGVLYLVEAKDYSRKSSRDSVAPEAIEKALAAKVAGSLWLLFGAHNAAQYWKLRDPGLRNHAKLKPLLEREPEKSFADRAARTHKIQIVFFLAETFPAGRSKKIAPSDRSLAKLLSKCLQPLQLDVKVQTPHQSKQTDFPWTTVLEPGTRANYSRLR